ncbi:protein PSK simulator 1 [Tanacetum coccineum]
MMKESSWLSTMLRTPHKNKGLEPEYPVIGIISFEAARMMCKVANLWHSLSDRQMSLLKEELRYSHGIRTLISDDYSYLIDRAFEEFIENLQGVAISVARLGKKCMDPVYHNLDHVFDNPFEIDVKWCGWEYRLKKMEKRVKKMKRFTGVICQLHEELGALTDLETRLTKMQSNGVNKGQLREFNQKVMWRREEVSVLGEMSPWVRSYDYIVRLLLRSLFTIVERMKVVFGITTDTRSSEAKDMPHGGCFVRKSSISALAGSSVYPSESSFRRSMSSSGHTPSRGPSTCHRAPVLCGRYPSITPQRGTGPPVTGSFNFNCIFQNDLFDPIKKTTSAFNSKLRLVHIQEPSLGNAALALRYANIIIHIETLAMSPRFMSSNARADLYDLLTTNIKHSLREKLFISRKEASLTNDQDFQRILDWLSPLAHNMLKWYSERNFEKQPVGSGGNVLLVQTLYYADQAASEIAITELLVGLHYVSKSSQETIDKSFIKSV